MFAFEGDFANLTNVALTMGGATTPYTLQPDGANAANLLLNGQTVGKAEADGGVRVTLYAAYVDTLPDGQYTLTVYFNDEGVAASGAAAFAIQRGAAPTPPPTPAPPTPGGGVQTGDGANPGLWLALAGAALAGLGTLLGGRSKRRQRQ